MKLKQSLIDLIEKNNFSVNEIDGNYEFGIYSPAGQDFRFKIEAKETLEKFAEDIFRYYENYNVSEETYLWLDDTGHGKNGAPL